MCSKKKKKKKKQEVRQAGTKININSCTYRLLYNIICGVPKRFEGKRTDGRTEAPNYFSKKQKKLRHLVLAVGTHMSQD